MSLQRRAERALDALSFFVSDARYGLGAYLGVYLMTEHAWDAATIGAALSIGALTGLASQAPLGALVDAVRTKRALIAGAVVMVTATCLVIPLAPRFWPVAAAGLVGALAGVTIGPTLASISLGVVGPARFARRAGRNEALFHLGDGSLSLMILLTAPLFGSAVLFWSMAFTAVASTAAAAAGILQPPGAWWVRCTGSRVS
jgi:MFS family permease